jgi:hypothetical protein
VIEGAIRAVAIVASLIVVAGFTLFAVDEFSGASSRQQTWVENPGAEPGAPSRGEKPRSGVRKTIEDANDALLSPFKGLAQTESNWANHMIPTVLALLVYGLGLGFLARYIRQRA